jgi:hypothetical protein
MLVRWKLFFFAFWARRALRYWIDAVTILAPEAEAPARSKIGRPQVLFEPYAKEPIGALRPGGFSTLPNAAPPQSQAGPARNTAFLPQLGDKGLICGRVYETIFPSSSAIFRVVR